MKTRKTTGTITQDLIDEATQILQDLPEKPRQEVSLKEAISLMYDDIAIALERGYSYDEVAVFLKKQGVEISASTLKSYLAQSKSPSKKRGTRRKKAAAATVSAPATVVKEAPEAAPAKATRKPRATKAAAPAAAKPAAKTAAAATKTRRSSTVARGRAKK